MSRVEEPARPNQVVDLDLRLGCLCLRCWMDMVVVDELRMVAVEGMVRGMLSPSVIVNVGRFLMVT